MATKVETLRRAANAATDRLVELTKAVNLVNRYNGRVEKQDALSEAQAVNIIAKALLGASEAALDAFAQIRPPDQHYHTHQAPILPISSISSGSD